MKNCKKIIALLITILLFTSVMAGCQGRSGDDETSSGTSQSGSSETAKANEEETVADIIPNLIPEIEEKKKVNEDAVGWLQIPQLGMDEVVVFNPDEAFDYYLRRNFEKEPEYNGVIFADFRSKFGDGSIDQLGLNTCLYGHSMTDDSSNKKYQIFFGPLHDLRDPEIAKTIPYLLFSTEKENLAFEIFAIFIANSDNAELPYNSNDVPADEFYKMIQEQVLPRSIYNYNTEIKEDDKFLTLSTCIYTLPDGKPTGYPETYYRYAIMAKLVDPEAPLKEEADFTINESALLDADGKISSK